MSVAMNPRIFLLSVALLGVPSCIIAAAGNEPPPPAVVEEVVEEASGLVTIDWSIHGDRNPNECDRGDAEALLISIWSASGAHVGDFEQYCQVFQTSIELEPGTYKAEAVLIAPDGIERTTTADIAPFAISDNDLLDVAPIDFPASSFY